VISFQEKFLVGNRLLVSEQRFPVSLQSNHYQMKNNRKDSYTFTGADIGTLILDTDLKIIRFTEEAKRILNLKDSDPGQPLRDYDTIISGAYKALETLTTYEKEIQDNDGNWYLLGISPLISQEGKAEGVIVILVNNNILKNAESELDATEERLTRAMVAGNMAWWEMELPSGKITFNHNKTRMLGLKGEDFKHFQDFMQIVHPEDCDGAMNAMYDHLHGKAAVYACEYRMKNAGGNYQWFQDVGKIVYKDEGKMLVAGIVSEITERKRIEKQLKEAKLQAEMANNYKNQFLANVSHEIRTPISGMVGFASLLRKEDLDVETKKLYIDIIESSSKQLLNLVNDIIDISRIEAGELKMSKAPCELHKILKETETLFEQLKHARGKQNLKIRLNLSGKDEALFIVTDPDRLKQILINLIGNALKFTETGGVDFGYELENDRLKFYVSDTGIGMSEDDLKLVFERFKRTEQAHKKYEGTGLGLAITKGLLDLLGGDISVHSEVGRGSVFTFTIPYEPSKPEQVKSPEEQVTDTERLRGKKILIAEDEKINRMYLEIILKDLPIQIFWARNGLEAVEIFSENRDINLVLMDIKMPLMDGEEAMQKILAWKPGTRIVAQTANALSSDREKYLESGFVDHISKPIDKKQLIRIMEKWVL
jgi:two-component system CheB/CheR fusion protein